MSTTVASRKSLGTASSSQGLDKELVKCPYQLTHACTTSATSSSSLDVLPFFSFLVANSTFAKMAMNNGYAVIFLDKIINTKRDNLPDQLSGAQIYTTLDLAS